MYSETYGLKKAFGIESNRNWIFFVRISVGSIKFQGQRQTKIDIKFGSIETLSEHLQKNNQKVRISSSTVCGDKIEFMRSDKMVRFD